MKKTAKLVCPCCGADNSAGKRCDCQKVDIDIRKIPAYKLEPVARALLRAVEEAFKDPVVVADYEEWLAEREKAKARSDSSRG